jgi:hypothetical protein
MEKRFCFSNKSVVEFCRATADDNPIHNPEIMHNQNKGVVVPGMLLFSSIASLLHELTNDYYNYFKLVFGNVVCTNEDVELKVTTNPNNEDEKFLQAINGHDLFSTKKERSYATNTNSPLTFELDGVTRTLKYNKKQLNVFRSISSCVNKTLSDFLFAIAYASAALFKSIREPITDVEVEINQLLDKNLNPKQVSPFYQDLEIYRPGGFEGLNSDGELQYNVNFQREVKNRLYSAKVACIHNGSVLYYSIYKLVAIPDKLILRMVKNLNATDKISTKTGY